MNKAEASALIKHYSDWSGGWAPGSEPEIVVFLDYACPIEVEPREAKRLLIAWSERVGRRICRQIDRQRIPPEYHL